MMVRRVRMTVVAGALALGAWLALGSAPALAGLRYPFESQLTGFPNVSFGEIQGESVAFDDKTGDAFVADSLNGVVYVFDSSHNYITTWTGSNTPAGSFGGSLGSGFCGNMPADDGACVGVAVNNDASSANYGDVYVVDTVHAVVDHFDSAGNPIGSPWTGPSAGESFAIPRGVTVDQATGDVYVLDLGNRAEPSPGAVYVFDSEGAYISQISAALQGVPNGFSPLTDGVAVDDRTGDVLVADGFGVVGRTGYGDVYVFSSAGVYETTITGSDTPAGNLGKSTLSVAADNTSGYVYVSDNTHDVVDVLDSSGNYVGQITGTPGGAFGKVAGVAVDQANENVAVSDNGGHAVDFYGWPPLVVPDAFTEAATNITGVAATLNGKITPDGLPVTGCHFEYGTTTSYGQSAPCDQSLSAIGTGSSPVAVTAEPSGLAPDTAYHFRLDAADANGETEGIDATFTTPAAVVTQKATDITETSATLNGTVNPYGSSVTSCHFEYGPTASYGQTAPCAQSQSTVGTGESPVPVSASVTLKVGSYYHFRVVAGTASWSDHGQDMTFATLPPPFAIESFDRTVTNPDGSPDVQAGSHPYALTTSFIFSKGLGNDGINFAPSENFKDVQVDLPPGIVGDPGAVPKCTHEQLVHGQCPVSAQVGIIQLYFGNNHVGGPGVPVFNMVAPSWEPAQLAFFVSLGETPVYLDVGVRAGGDYGLTVNVHNVSQSLNVWGQSLTVWGVPGDPSHDAERECFGGGGASFGCSVPAGEPVRPFLTLSTGCQGPQTTTLHVDTWAHPGVWHTATSVSHDGQGNPLGLNGCDRLDFGPSVEAAPDTTRADTPAGFTFDVKLGQEGLLNPEGLAGTDIENTTVRLPAGVAINPGQAAGLAACQPGEDALGSEAAPSCPSASKVGTVQISTPLLPDKLEGNVYILPSNPPDLKLLVAASADGVNVKLVGHVRLDETTGQLVTTFEGTPQLPFSEFRLSFSGGAQAALVTPTGCGTYQTSADFMPWSSPFEQDALVNSPFLIQTGPVGSPCASPLPFAPEMIAGATTDQAGGFTGFSMLLTRADGQQRVASLQFKTPPGLLGEISKVQLCGATEAAADACPEGSQIGHTVVEAGPGPYPLVVPQPGAPPAPIYLTGPYEGAPYGLLIKVPLVVGPFTLQTQVVRARIQVDPLTSQLTITTDPLPTIIDGIPADLRAINAVIDRSHFMFNPTDCEPLSFSGTATSTEGTSAAIASRFEVGSCRSLHFKPRFVVLTAGQTSRRNGASLDARVVFPREAPEGNQMTNQANIRSVKVSLPRALPSRLGTLQKACPAETFQTDPAACPPASRVGSATAITPVLPGALSGPAYFVSHGGAKFPELVIVLSGDNVTVDLHGETFISKAGITSSTFHYVPDVPIESFELKLPQGPYSALAANGNLCTTSLRMPTVFTAQNGMVIHQSTQITATSCARHKTHHKHHKRKHRKK